MQLENLRSKWTKSPNYKEETARDLWNPMADNFGTKEIPSMENNEFLRLINERVHLTDSTISLDIGCGTGVYSMALAPRMQEVVGCDVADRMIDIAQKKAAENGISNAKFLCIDWETADIESLGFRNRFDIVFAHMTPAVNNYDTLEKMVGCAKQHCFLQKPFRRQDRVLDGTMEILGLKCKDKESDEIMENIFLYLWRKGYEPQFEYKKTVMKNDKSIEDALSWSVGWAKMQREIGPNEEQAVRKYLKGLADGRGMIHEFIQTTLVTIDWKVR